MKILVVEDENSIREVEAAYLKRSGYSVLEAEDGKKAFEMFKTETPDLVLLDLNLPEIDGINLCKKIREINKSIPIIMVTARVEEIDEIIGLEIGADDYIKKPFSPNILVARVASLLRRFVPTKIDIGDLSIDADRMSVLKKGETILLTTTQFSILHLMAQNPGKVFSRDEILERISSDYLPKDVLERTVDAHIKTIRKLIEDDTKKPQYIITVIGKGYKFNSI